MVCRPEGKMCSPVNWSGGWSTGTVGWVSASEWGQYLKRWHVMNTTCLVPLPFLPDTLVYWESFSWLTCVGTTQNTVIRLGGSRIGLALLILHAAGAGLIGRPAVISGHYNKCHSLQPQNYYTFRHWNTYSCRTQHVMGNDHGFRCIVCWTWQEESYVIG